MRSIDGHFLIERKTNRAHMIAMFVLVKSDMHKVSNGNVPLLIEQSIRLHMHYLPFDDHRTAVSERLPCSLHF